MTTTVVFLGPSLPVERAQEILPDAVYLPPAGQGDVISVARSVRPDRIAVIDGLFHHSLPVWHREILDALSLGVLVYGASSMGALRAAECSPFGMIGVGAIYQAYAEGRLTDDDEVAVVHTGAEDGWRCLSVPMVNIRATVAAAVEAGRLAERWHSPLVLAAKRSWYPERTVEALCAEGHRLGMTDTEIAGLRSSFLEHLVDVKAADARLLLQRLAAPAETDHLPDDSQWTLNTPVFYRALVDRDRWVIHAGATVRLARIAEYQALTSPAGVHQREDALNRAVALALSASCGIEPGPEQVEAELQRLCHRHGLDREDLETWAARNDLTMSEVHRLASEEAVLRHLRGWLVQQASICNGTGPVLDHLRVRGGYPKAAAMAARHQQCLDSCRPDPAEALPAVEPMALLRAHAAATGCTPEGGLAGWAEGLGFASTDELLRAMAEQQVVRQQVVRQQAVRQQVLKQASGLHPKSSESAPEM